MQSVPPTAIPALFKTSLEPSLLVAIISVFREVIHGSKDVEGLVRNYMDAFAHVQRLETVILFLNRKEKEVVMRCWETLGLGKEDVAKVWKSVWI